MSRCELDIQYQQHLILNVMDAVELVYSNNTQAHSIGKNLYKIL